jgi:hypothetical protein
MEGLLAGAAIGMAFSFYFFLFRPLARYGWTAMTFPRRFVLMAVLFVSILFCSITVSIISSLIVVGLRSQ